MSRATRSRPADGPGTRRAARRRRTHRAWPLALPLALVVVVAAVAAVLWWLVRPQPSSRPPTTLGADPAAGMDPHAARDRAKELMRAHLPTASLPYFRRALAGLPAVPPAFRLDYSSALVNASTESRTHLGLPGPAARSSWDRVALARESLRQIEIVEGQSLPPQRARVMVLGRGQRLQTWGLPWDALAAYGAAMALDPAWPDLRRHAAAYARRLRFPEQPDGAAK